MQAESSSVLSIRATAMNSLSLLCDTALKFLSPLGWVSNLTSNLDSENPDDLTSSVCFFRESISGFYDANELLFADRIAVKLMCKEFVDKRLAQKSERAEEGDTALDARLDDGSPKIGGKIAQNYSKENDEAAQVLFDDRRMSILPESSIIQSSGFYPLYFLDFFLIFLHGGVFLIWKILFFLFLYCETYVLS